MSDTPISDTPMSATPRTDKYNRHCAECHKVNGMTLIQHARQLERELQTAKDEGYNQGFREGLAFKG